MENRRAHKRVAVAVAAELEVEGATFEAETRDVSEGGVALLLSVPPPEGSKVALTLILTQDGIEDPNEEPYQSEASVMWAAPTDGGHTLVGLRYIAPAAAQLARLRRFLAAVSSSQR